MDGDLLKAKVEINTERFFNKDSNFGIVSFTVKEYMKGSQILSLPPRCVAKGIMPQPIIGAEYFLEAKEITDPKWGKQFEIKRIYSSLFLNESDKRGQKIFLESIFTDLQVSHLYEVLADPYQVLKDGNAQDLVKVKGCGIKTAANWIQKFQNNLANSRVYAELSQYNLTKTAIQNLLKHYGSPDVVINTVKNHPYDLMDVDGIGWKKCDLIAQDGGLDKHCPERVIAFLKQYFKDEANNGRMFVYANEQMLPAILEMLGEDIPDEPILEALKRMDGMLVWSEDRTAVGLKKCMELEQKIAKKLIELRDAPNEFKYEGWEQIIKNKEEEQGWEYTDQQKAGIRAALEQQVVLVTGGAGTGKTSVVAGMLAVLKKYDFAQCALSGRAAARMSETTHQEGFTIHRLLGYPAQSGEYRPWGYGPDKPLSQQIIIVDEISMVDGELFWYLIRSLKPGTKLIMLGDVGQLESLGCSNIAHDLIFSPEICSIELNKIHRQAAASAIITESIAVRKGNQVIDKNFVGTVTRGELQDLTYDCYSDASNTFYHVLEWASRLKEEGISTTDTQVIVPIKERQSGTWTLNLALQEIYNPLSDDKPQKQLLVNYEKGKSSYLRVGDKVINIQNTYGSRTYADQWEMPTKQDAEGMGDLCPVFNGNMGIIKDINEQREEMIVEYIGIGRVLITRNMLKNTMLGYAVTVHKCQGSEFKHVIFGVDFSSYSLLTRQLIYTAITRASVHCYVIAQTGALRYAVSKNSVSKKQTVLPEELHRAANPVF